MPNRIIKESICTSENLNSLSRDAEIFFYRLMVNCDDYGLMDARVPILRAKCFPLRLDLAKDKDVEKWIKELEGAKLIFLYTTDSKQYLKMTKWERHQQIRNHKSKYPQPDINCNQLISSDSRCYRNPIQSESNPNPNTNTNACDDITPDEIPDNGGEPETGVDDVYTAEFESFWFTYPRRKEKRKAFKAWNARIKDKVSPEGMIQAARNYSVSCKNQRVEEKFIKYPSTFLGPDKPYEEYIECQPISDNKNIPANVQSALELVEKYKREEENGNEEE